MSTSNNKVVSHTSIYMFGDMLRYSTSLIMLPIYTRYLTPEDYGVVELLTMLIDFAAIIFGARVGQSVFRFYCTASSDDEKKNIISSALLLGVLFNGIGAIAITVLSGPLAEAIFSDLSFQRYIVLFSITMFMLPLTEIPLVHVRAQQKPWLFFTFSVAKLTLQLGLNIYLVVYHEMHVAGVVYSAVISSVVMAIFLTGYSLSKTGMCATKATCKKMFSFSLPLKLASIGSFYLAFGDRYFLNVYSDLSQVGIYALGYKFGFIFTMISWTPFEKMWDAEKYTIHEKPNAKAIYQKIFLYISSILILLGLCISLFTKDLLKIMADPAFLSAYEIVPIIILAYIFQAWTRYCNLGILLKNKTMQIAHAEMIAVLVMTVAYFTLIPAYGIHGAAWATVIGFATRFYWTQRKGKQHYDMELPWIKVIMIAALAMAFFALSLLIPDDLILSITLRAVLVLSFIAVFFALPVFPSNEKEEVMRAILSLKSHPIFSFGRNK
jgi:O-antigen/teichoic acid export membrane protein